jgi:hypothetical protein
MRIHVYSNLVDTVDFIMPQSETAANNAAAVPLRSGNDNL